MASHFQEIHSMIQIAHKVQFILRIVSTKKNNLFFPLWLSFLYYHVCTSVRVLSKNMQV